ncbi:MAG TPA: M42 family metallopeptidase [Gemmataceae bacterium]|nr:M42 family metallopeptidase [Gemmataceae bacterium]
MHESSLAFLKKLLTTPSASGFEHAIQDVVRSWARSHADEVRTDRHGNVIAVLHPSSPPQERGEGVKGHPRVMLAGHCDQIALMVQHIDDNGFLYVQPIGGWDMQILLGQNLTVWTNQGPVAGVVSRRAPHLLTNEERNKVPQFADIWVDIGAKDRKEAEALVTPGDPVTFALGYRELRNNLAVSPAMDDKVGVWVVMETLRLLRGRPLQVSVYCVSTVQEEIGLRGATTSTYGIHPTVGIAVDVCHATDTPGNDKKQLGDVRLGAGPTLFRGANINPRVFERLHETAKAHEIPVQVRGSPRATGTDANVMQLSRDGVATGLVGIPNRYMHSPVEVVCLDDLERAARLLAEFCLSITPQMDWTP